MPEPDIRDGIRDSDFERLEIAPRLARLLFVAGGAIIAVASLVSSYINVPVSAGDPIEFSGLQSTAALAILPATLLVLAGLMFPSRTTLFRRELARRLAEFNRASHAIDVTNLAQIDAVLNLKERLKLLDPEVDVAQLVLLRGYREVLSSEQATERRPAASRRSAATVH